MDTFYKYLVKTFIEWLKKMEISLPIILWTEYNESMVHYSLSTFMREQGIYLVGECVLKASPSYNAYEGCEYCFQLYAFCLHMYALLLCVKAEVSIPVCKVMVCVFTKYDL